MSNVVEEYDSWIDELRLKLLKLRLLVMFSKEDLKDELSDELIELIDDIGKTEICTQERSIRNR